ncbi:MAG TPA: hypothetical protein HPP81_11780 [Deltaproteobacteria bacterium]|nr:hypothetical protein [Deltaproteobacteria bacterium]
MEFTVTGLRQLGKRPLIVLIADGHCPADLIRKAIEECGRKPGVVVYVINYELKDWLRVGFHC